PWSETKMSPSPRRAMPIGCDRPEVMKFPLDPKDVLGERNTTLLALSTISRSPVFFWAIPWSLLPAPCNCIGARDPPEPNSTAVIPGNIHHPDPESLLETTRSPVNVMRPHCGCCSAPFEYTTSGVIGTAAAGSKRTTLLLLLSHAYTR